MSSFTIIIIIIILIAKMEMPCHLILSFDRKKAVFIASNIGEW